VGSEQAHKGFAAARNDGASGEATDPASNPHPASLQPRLSNDPETQVTLYARFAEHIDAVLDALEGEGSLAPGTARAGVAVEPPRDPSHGDLATNAAMVLARKAGTNPRALAELIAPRLGELPEVDGAEIAGPGFINLRLNQRVWQGELEAILEGGPDYGRSTLGKDIRVNVEYVSANPTGPMHMGHCRGAVVGDALASLLEHAGFAVTREYYVNDAGAQVDTLARSAHLRYREALGHEIGEIPEGLYPGDYLKPVGLRLANQHSHKYANAPEEEWLDLFKRGTVEAMLELIRADLALLGVHHDLFASEREVQESGAVDRAFALLEEKGLVYRGTLEPPKGKVIEDWEPTELLLFRSTAFGTTRTADQEGGRKLDLFRSRHRLSHAEAGGLGRADQRLGRRSHRHRQTHPGRGPGACRPARARRQDRADGPAAEERRAGQDVEAARAASSRLPKWWRRSARTRSASPC
jgi:hypothetical protein